MIKDIKYEYIALLDVDDLWLPNKLELQIPFLNDYDVVGTHCQYFGDMNGYPSIPFNDINNYNFFLANPIINSSVILHISNAFWDENTILEDYDLWFKLYHNKKKFYNLSDVLCKHRIHKQSAFNNTNNYAVDDLKNKWFKIIFNINKL